MRKNIIIFKYFRLFLVFLIAFLCLQIISPKKVFADTLQQSSINITYSVGEIYDINRVSIEKAKVETVNTTYNPDVYSIELPKYNSDFDMFEVLEVGKIIEEKDGVEYIYNVGFAGWQLVSINGDIIDETYFYPANDYIYLNDKPFVNKGNIESMEFKALWGKTIYLRDQYNFKDITDVFGDNPFTNTVDTPKIDWDTEKEYAFEKEKAYKDIKANDLIVTRKHEKSTPVYSLTDAVDMLGEDGGVVEIVNHYTLDHVYGHDTLPQRYSGAFVLGQNIKNGVLTISGYKNGYTYLDDETTNETFMNEGKEAYKLYNANVVKELYNHAYLFYKNTCGAITTSSNLVQYGLIFYCDASLEGLNITGYRETYYSSSSSARNTLDGYIFGYMGKRIILQDSVATFKRGLTHNESGNDGKTYKYYNYDAGNWSHLKFYNYETISGKKVRFTIEALSQSAVWINIYAGFLSDQKEFSNKLTYNTTTFNTENYDATNVYMTLRGYENRKSLFYSVGVSPYILNIDKKTEKCTFSRVKKDECGYDYKNVHLALDGVYVNQFYGLRDGSSSTSKSTPNYIDFYGIIMIDSIVSSKICTSAYDTSFVYVNNLVFYVNSDPNCEMMTYRNSKGEPYIYGNMNIGGMSNSSDGSNQSLYANNVKLKVEEGRLSNIYGGGNQIAVQNVYNNLEFEITGGEIKDIYGGGLGGFLIVNNDINFDITGGTFDNIYGGGSGGLVLMSSTNGILKMDSNYDIKTIPDDTDDELDDHYYFGHQFAHIKNAPKQTKNAHYLGFSFLVDELEINSNNYTSLNIIYAYNNTDPNNYLAYYRSYYTYIVSDALVTANSINMTIDLEDKGVINQNVYGGGQNGAVKVKEAITINHLSGKIVGNIYGGGCGKTESFDLYSFASLDWLTSNFIFTVDETKIKDDLIYNAVKFEDFSSFTIDETDEYTTLYERAKQVSSTYTWAPYLGLKDLKYKFDYYYEERLKYGSKTNEMINLTTFYLYTSTINDLGLINGNTIVNLEGGTVTNVFGASEGIKGNVIGSTTLNINAGTVKGSIYGGGDLGGVSKNDTDPNSGSTNITIGGNVQISGDVYGGSNQSMIEGDANLTINNGTIRGNIYGGGNLGIVDGMTNVVVNNTANKIATLYAGGNQAAVNGGTNLWVNGSNFNQVYGGGNLGEVKGDINVTLANNPTINELYAASNQADVIGNVTLAVNGGDITYIFGGNNIKGDISGDILIDINNGTICSLYGGGNQADYYHKTTINFNDGTLIDSSVNISDNAIYGGGKEAYVEEVFLNISGGVIQTSVYGGGYSGNVKNANLSISGAIIGTGEDAIFGGGYAGDVDNTKVSITNNPTINATIYGGGEDGRVTLSATTEITGGIISKDIYGGGKGTDALTKKVDVLIENVSVDHTLYGGGNLGIVSDEIDIIINNSHINTVYGGGNLAQALTNTDVIVKGSSSIETLFGGGNNAKVLGQTKVTVNDNSVIDLLYGGGNLANVNNVDITINDGTFENLYGGGNQGMVEANVKITINNGTFNDIVYGGGFEGNVENNTNINICGGTFKHNVYGGGYAGTVGYVDMKITDEENVVIINGDVFAGGEGITATVKETKLEIDLEYKSLVKETLEVEDANDINSGQADVEIESETITSKILGSVYGGGDLGQIGEGSINTSSNTATITTVGKTEVLIKNGYIGDSIFAGGRGVAPSGVAYNVYMGTVFGTTLVTVNSGYIGGNIYGGGRQSRVYAAGSLASTVNIIQEKVSNSDIEVDYNLFIYGSVFGGGDRGTGSATNASVPTTIGNVEVNIIGSSEGTAIYFDEGGVYGDGNLCLVNGNRKVKMENFTTGSNGKLKTFFSLQRADIVDLFNTDIVLLGAIDKVEEGDDTTYSINRIDRLNLNRGSTIKLSTIVKYLAFVYSDYENGNMTPDRKYIYKGNNGVNNYEVHGGTLSDITPLTEDEIEAYQKEYEEHLTSGTNNPQNTISVANGLYLQLMDSEGEYGKVIGLFTLQLLVPTPGEGGGIVYADIPNSSGDFICLTKFEGDNAEYMKVLDDLCRATLEGYTSYFWYIAGTKIKYTINLTGYIGSSQTTFEESVTTPKLGIGTYFVLAEIIHLKDSKLEESCVSFEGETTAYKLVNKNNSLVNNEIAIEVLFCDKSLGYLTYEILEDADTGDKSVVWGIQTVVSGINKVVYGHKHTPSGITQNESNIIGGDIIDGTEKDYSITLALHKSSEVNKEFGNLDFEFQIDLFNYILDPTEEDPYHIDFRRLTGQSNELFFKCYLAIRRLVPVQNIYYNTGHLFGGVTSTNSIAITMNSSFTFQVQTRYIPGAFPIIKDGEGNITSQLSWSIRSYNYNYYFDSLTGYYLVTDINDKIVDYADYFTDSIEKVGDIYVIKPSAANLVKDGDKYTYTYGLTSETRNLILMSKASHTYFPKGTRITLVDNSETAKKFYYYIVTNDTTDNINLLDFLEMGSNIPIRHLNEKPIFMGLYDNEKNKNTRVTENLIFIFDYFNVEEGSFDWNIKEEGSSINTQFIGSVNLAHEYEGVDIMNYVKTPETNEEAYSKECPKVCEVKISRIEIGITQAEDDFKFKEEEYYSQDDYELEIRISEDIEWTNTEFKQKQYAAFIELIDLNGNVILMPEGMSFELNGKLYYSKTSGKNVIVPLVTAGTHKVTIKNNMYGLLEYLKDIEADVIEDGKYVARFRTSTYSSAYSEYYNDQRIELESQIDSFVLNENPKEAISVGIENPIIKEQEINLKVNSLNDTTLTLEVYRKVNGRYQKYPNASDFIARTLNVVSGENQIIIFVSDKVEIGTYQIVLKSGNKKDSVTVIIVNNS